MKRDEAARSNLILFAAFFIPVIWLALLVAPAWSEGLPSMLVHLSTAMRQPLNIEWVDDTPRC